MNPSGLTFDSRPRVRPHPPAGAVWVPAAPPSCRARWFSRCRDSDDGNAAQLARRRSCQYLVALLVWVRARHAYAGGDEALQTATDVEAPCVRAHIEALVRRDQTRVSEADFGRAVLLEELEPDLGVLPLALVVDEIHVGVENPPDDLLAGNPLRHPDLGVVDVFDSKRELLTDLLSTALDLL